MADVLLSGGLSDGNPSLNIRHLTGTFVILLVGYALAILTFILEKIIHLFHIQYVAVRQVVVQLYYDLDLFYFNLANISRDNRAR